MAWRARAAIFFVCRFGAIRLELVGNGLDEGRPGELPSVPKPDTGSDFPRVCLGVVVITGKKQRGRSGPFVPNGFVGPSDFSADARGWGVVACREEKSSTITVAAVMGEVAEKVGSGVPKS